MALWLKATTAPLRIDNSFSHDRTLEWEPNLATGGPACSFDCAFVARWPCPTNAIGYCRPMTVY